MATVAKLSWQPRTESCVVVSTALRSVDREAVGRNISERKDSPKIDATSACALAGPDAADAARANPGASSAPQPNASRSLCVLRHCRELPGTAASPSGRGVLLAQNAEQPKLDGHDLVEVLSSDTGADSASATKAVSPVCGATSYRHVVNHSLTSAVREIRTLRSVGAGAGDRSGHPVALGNRRPYRDRTDVDR
jgi:hypothetical protein